MKEDQFFEAFSQIDSQYIEDAKLHTVKPRVPIWLKILPLVLLLAAVLMHYSSGYYVYQEGDDYYIAFRGPRVAIEKYLLDNGWYPKHSITHVVRSVYMESGSTARSDIMSGNFSDVDMNNMRIYYLLHGPIKVPDMDEFYDPIYPECNGFKLAWELSSALNSRYLFDFGDTATSVMMSSSTEAQMENFKHYFDNKNISDNYGKLVATYTDETRNGTVYHFVEEYNWESHTESQDWYFVTYEITVAERTLYVLEEYYSNNPETNVPAYVKVQGVYNGIYFSLRINNPKDRPSVEWLSSFGLKEIE